MSKIVVIYHSQDFDGIFCREIARKHYGDQAEYIGWDYGDLLPDVSQAHTVVMLDVSIDGLMNHPDLVWIDHHKTAIEKYPAQAAAGYCVDGVAACRLAYQVFLGPSGYVDKQAYIDRTVTEPLSVRLAGEYDVWDKRDSDADTFQYGLRCFDKLSWHQLLDTGEDGKIAVKYILGLGLAAQDYAANLNAEIIKASGYDVEFSGMTFLALNTARCNSLTFEAGIKDRHDGLIGFRHDGKQWVVSLYGVPHKPEIDLSPIASRFGGGGHKQACGFRCEHLPFHPYL